MVCNQTWQAGASGIPLNMQLQPTFPGKILEINGWFSSKPCLMEPGILAETLHVVPVNDSWTPRILPKAKKIAVPGLGGCGLGLKKGMNCGSFWFGRTEPGSSNDGLFETMRSRVQGSFRDSFLWVHFEESNSSGHVWDCLRHQRAQVSSLIITLQ